MRPKLIQSKLKAPPLPILIDANVRHIRELPGYAIDSLGRVWSCKVERTSKFGEWHQIKLAETKLGRKRVNLRLNGIRRVILVHHLVAQEFLGERPTGLNVLHRDGNCRNNVPENLYFGTQADNASDSIRHGTHPWLSKNRKKAS